MIKDVKIEVLMYQDTDPENQKEPYFWRIAVCHESSWCTHTSGWAATPEEAWQQANRFYQKYLKEGKI